MATAHGASSATRYASPLARAAISGILARTSADGAFRARPEGEPRLEATAWGALALAVAGDAGDAAPLARARARLADAAGTDGRLSASPLHPGAYWPTPLAILAWHGSSAERAASERAVAFLLAHRGETLSPKPDAPIELDGALAGWPWIDRTFSWVEPTSLAILALAASGRGADPRAEEGRRLLVDRQIPGGGWNYGNKIVFGSALRPAPESTGPALAALATSATPAARNLVAPSLAWLAGALSGIRTPLSLGWGILALSAWGIRPTGSDAWLAESLAREARFDGYETAELALVALAAAAPRGLLAALPAGDSR